MKSPYMRHDSSLCETWFIHTWDITSSQVRHNSFTWAITRRIRRALHPALSELCNMTHSYMRHDSFIYGTCLISKTQLIQLIQLIHTWDMTENLRATCLIYIRDTTNSYVKHNSYGTSASLLPLSTSTILVTWLIHICYMTHTHTRHDTYMSETSSFICKTWHIWDMTHTCERQDPLICNPLHIFDELLTYISVYTCNFRDTTHSYMRHDSFEHETWHISVWNMTHL